MPLNGPNQVRWVRGIGYPRVRKGGSYGMEITVSLSKDSRDRHDHFEDDAIALHKGDFDLSVFNGLPMRRNHKTKPGDIGQWDGAKINDKNELEVWGQIHSHTDAGYNAICDFDHGLLNGISIKFHAAVSPEKRVLGKRIEEMSLTPTGGAHYDNCFVTVACSKPQVTTAICYTPKLGGTSSNSKKYQTQGGTSTSMNNLNTAQQTNGQPPSQAPAQSSQNIPQQQAPQQNTPQQPTGSQNPLGDAQNYAALIEDLKAQLKKENDAKKNFQKQLNEEQAVIKGYREKEQKETEARNAKILADLPGTLDVLSKLAGVKSAKELNPKTVEYLKSAWTNPEHEQLLNMTKNAALRLVALEKEQKQWHAQRKQLGDEVRAGTVSVAAGKAQHLLEQIREEERRESMRKLSANSLSFQDVYTPNQQEQQSQQSQQPPTRPIENTANQRTDIFGSPNIPLVRGPQPTKFDLNPAFGAQLQQQPQQHVPSTVTVGASAPKVPQQNVGRFSNWMSESEARGLVQVKLSRAPMQINGSQM